MAESKILINNKLILLPVVVAVAIVLLTFYSSTKTRIEKNTSQEAIEYLSSSSSYPYNIKDSKVRYFSEAIEGADANTFEVISNKGYARDKKNVYLGGSKITGADPKSFSLLKNADGNSLQGYSKDKNHVYLNGHKLEDSDPETFELIKKDLTYGRDKDHVYLGEYLIKRADPETFQIVSAYNYSKDKKSVYFITEAIPNSDPATLESVTNLKGEALYYKDKNNVYDPILGVITNANPLTFRPLGSGYSQDDRLIYYSTTSLPRADLKSFLSLGDSYAKDKNYLYREGKIIFDLSKAVNPFELAAKHILDITPKGDITIDYIVNTYYDLTLYYGNYSKFNIFQKEGKDRYSFFSGFFEDTKRATFDLIEFVPFRLAFVAPNSPAETHDFPQLVGPSIGGEVVGRKFLDKDTMIVYGRRGWQEYLGPAAYMCKGQGDSIDKFVFKRVNSEWKIWEIEEEIDSWVTNNEGDTKEECKEINQDKIEKYQIGQ